MIVKQICPKCKKQFEIECTQSEYEKSKYRKYCSRSCANSHKLTNEQKQNISNGVKNSIKYQISVKRRYGEKIKEYVCDKCGKKFQSTENFRKNRKVHCEDCKRKVVHYHNLDDIESILDCSKRTLTKILKRSEIGCAICGWNESTCDIHHIIQRKDGGSDKNDNLIIVCPNHHRIIHTNKCYSIEFLKSLSISNKFSDWKKYYHIER